MRAVPVRVAVPVEGGEGLDARLSDRFGRAPYFLIADVEPGEGCKVVSYRVVENPGARSGSGAGVKAAQTLADNGVRVYIGPSPGPNARAALEALGIRVISHNGGTAREAIEAHCSELA